MNTVNSAAYEGDIVSRLRNWRGLHLAHGGELFEEAADEIERLRLTEFEKEAIEQGASCISRLLPHWGHPMSLRASALRSLLERMNDQTIGQRLAERVSLTQEVLEENERLREAIRRLADQDATLSVQGGNVTVTVDATLTDEERKAVRVVASVFPSETIAATLRSLLARLA